MIMIDNAFDLGQTIYLRTDLSQSPRIIIGIKKCMDNGILYEAVSGVGSTWHYEQEMSAEQDVALKMG